MAVNKFSQRYSDTRIIKIHLCGFSLVELMVVVIIIAILAALVMPKYDKTVENSRIAEAKHVLGMMRDSMIRYAELNDLYPTQSQLDINVTSAGKFFIFEVYPGGSYTNGVNEIIAKATRNGIKVGGGYDPGYWFFIWENGGFSAGAPGGGEPPPQQNESS